METFRKNNNFRKSSTLLRHNANELCNDILISKLFCSFQIFYQKKENLQKKIIEGKYDYDDNYNEPCIVTNKLPNYKLHAQNTK